MLDEDDIATGEFEAVEVDDDGNPIIPKVTDEWLWAMNKAVTNMRKRVDIQVDRYDTFRPVPHIVRDTVESAAGTTVAATIASFFEITDGLELTWRYEVDGEFQPGGRIHLYGFAEVFGSWLGRIWGEHAEDADEADVDFTWEIRAFDAASEDDDYVTVMHTPEVLPTYNLFWHAPHGETYRLRVDFLEYLHCLTETCGLNGWQYLVCEDAFEPGSEAFERAEDARRRLSEIFPRADLSRYLSPATDEEE